MPITDIVNSPEEVSAYEESIKTEGSELAAWVLNKMTEWESSRDTTYHKRWGQYERLWRGIWSEQDKQRKSERSRLISPALSQAIESIVAEVEEALFSTGRFFDVDPDLREEEKQQMMALRDMLYNDMMTADVKSAISEIVLLAAIFGTGIGKIIVDITKNKFITPKPVNGLPEVVKVGATGEEEVVVRLVPVHPREFVIDSSSKNITDALGMGHVTIVPMHIVERRQREGVYRKEANVSEFTGDMHTTDGATEQYARIQDGAKIYEYHGLVPLDKLSEAVLGEDVDGLDNELFLEEEEMVEAIITVTDGGELLRAIANPNVLEDRNFISFQFDTVPNKFWGRGAAEKGFNPQMALDGELRSRHDGMALAIHPMLAVDVNSMPPGANVTVSPGRTILTNGDPTTALKPMNFGTLGTDTFSQSADLERQVAKATGAFDDQSMNVSGAKTGAVGMAISGAIKRSQRTLSNIERNFITPMVHKFAWRYMQFAPEKYNVVNNPKFVVTTTQGIMAKEWEVTQLGNMLKTVTPDTPAYWMLLKGIFQNSSIKNREEFDKIIGSQLEASMNPQPSQAEVANMEYQKAKIKIDLARARAELLRIEMDAQKLETGNLKTFTEAMLNVAKAEAEEAGSNIQEYNAILGRIKTGLDVSLKKQQQEQTQRQEVMSQQQQPMSPDMMAQ